VTETEFGLRHSFPSFSFYDSNLTPLISIFASDILPIFLIAAVGFLLARRLHASVTTLSHVAFYVFSPCFAFNTLVNAAVTGSQVGKMVLLAIFVAGAMGVIARIAAIPLQLSRAELSAFLLVVIFSNGGNYGLPVVLFAFGNEGLSQGTVYFVTSAILTYTVGTFLAASGRRNLRQAVSGIAKVPAVYGVTAALIVLATHVSIPLVAIRPIRLLGDALIPTMILVLGMQLERVKKLERPGFVGLAVVLSLLVTPLVALGLTWLLGITGPARQAGVLLASMPSAVITTILAVEFDVAPTLVTNVVFVTTLLSPFTLTLLIAYLR
jgi:malate permease and related proteins